MISNKYDKWCEFLRPVVDEIQQLAPDDPLLDIIVWSLNNRRPDNVVAQGFYLLIRTEIFLSSENEKKFFDIANKTNTLDWILEYTKTLKGQIKKSFLLIKEKMSKEDISIFIGLMDEKKYKSATNLLIKLYEKEREEIITPLQYAAERVGIMESEIEIWEKEMANLADGLKGIASDKAISDFIEYVGYKEPSIGMDILLSDLADKRAVLDEHLYKKLTFAVDELLGFDEYEDNLMKKNMAMIAIKKA